jgi:RNA polymerase sigma-70 factor (ECF subfamily)
MAGLDRSSDLFPHRHPTSGWLAFATSCWAPELSSRDEHSRDAPTALRADGEFERLVVSHLERVRNLAYRIVLCEATADDVAQEVFLRARASAATFRGDAALSTWLYRVTVNEAKSQLRKKRRSRESPLPAEEGIEHRGRDDGAGRESPSTELLQDMERALGQLSPKLRTAIVLTAIEQLSPSEAAAIDGCSTATMYWRIHQARKKLKHALRMHFES